MVGRAARAARAGQACGIDDATWTGGAGRGDAAGSFGRLVRGAAPCGVWQVAWHGPEVSHPSNVRASLSLSLSLSLVARAFSPLIPSADSSLLSLRFRLFSSFAWCFCLSSQHLRQTCGSLSEESVAIYLSNARNYHMVWLASVASPPPWTHSSRAAGTLSSYPLPPDPSAASTLSSATKRPRTSMPAAALV